MDLRLILNTEEMTYEDDGLSTAANISASDWSDADDSSDEQTASSVDNAFLFLPPEIRNLVYHLLLTNDEEIHVDLLYGQSTKLCLDPHLPKRAVASQISALNALGEVCRQVRHESRTYFYSTNAFTMVRRRTYYISQYLCFIRLIGPDARSLLSSVKLCGERYFKEHGQVKAFLALLNECTNLKQLTLWIHHEYIFERDFLFDLGGSSVASSAGPLEDFVANFSELSHLRLLHLFVGFDETWYRRGQLQKIACEGSVKIANALQNHFSLAFRNETVTEITAQAFLQRDEDDDEYDLFR
ncbi:hypothetical protein BCR34DRAFT_595892 [Clohesyomyces aquaticus]|uniref:Uncharacterized protein n=1 Tax=Clohesyomyces aquaticus TaxID=1231657 RepID=A0A1Y2A9B9_9PLEO|nr:hypothetical protein BCR34DRAFT_595892 [Clohesyomyces aquaticus]